MATLFQPSRAVWGDEAKIDAVANGDLTLVAAVAGKVIYVFQYFHVQTTTANVKFKSGANDLCGAMANTGGGSITFQATGWPWFKTNAGEAFIINTSGATQISGRIYFSVADS